MSDYAELDRAFRKARVKAMALIEGHNALLPVNFCPACGDEGHVPGLRCPACGYRHAVSWLIIRDTEWGYEAVALNNRRQVVATFNAEVD